MKVKNRLLPAILCLLSMVLVGRVAFSLIDAKSGIDSENGSYYLSYKGVKEQLILKDGRFIQTTNIGSKAIVNKGRYNSTGTTGAIKFDPNFLSLYNERGAIETGNQRAHGAAYSMVCPDTYDSCIIYVNQDDDIYYQRSGQSG